MNNTPHPYPPRGQASNTPGSPWAPAAASAQPGGQPGGYGASPGTYPRPGQPPHPGGPWRAGDQPVGPWQPTASAPKEPNPLGRLALVLAVVGTVLACLPVVRPLGWIILAAGLVLGIVALFRKNKKQGAALIAVASALIGATVAGGLAVMTLDNSFTTGFKNGFAQGFALTSGTGTPGGPVSYRPRDDTSVYVKEWSPLDPNATTGPGSRNEPIALGETIEFSGWQVSVDSVDLDGTDELMAVSEIIDAPDDGYQYALVELTLTYTGPGTGFSEDIKVGFVTDSGMEIPYFSRAFTSPDPELDDEIISGASATGLTNLQVSTGEEGLLQITARNDPKREVFGMTR